MPDERPSLLTTAQLARRLNIAARTLQRWRQEGWITPELLTVGGQARWVESDVRAQLRAIAQRERTDEEPT
ncbi:MerR family transcriptional regulator [Pseudonocardia humida]|uniref:MerR family transcriptional regulator n=1 Tax=Pseudonocardia humida TaxID=2800819 RepID=A0ABT1A460_9PSEU|nr:helix-turn-helix domain-containing protein [Pseudonocardia humida]MCO1657797.1 MerR family transcriptional regulator [Pseudonocardia humida]